MTFSLLNRETGKYEPLENPEQAFLSGTHGLAPNATVYFLNPTDNSIYSGPSEKAQQGLEMGLKFATPDQVQEHLLQKKFGEGFDAKSAAFLEAGARGLTFGVSDILLPELLNISKEAMAERKKRNKGIAISAEIGGAVVPILLSGGTGGVAKTASLAPTAMAAKIGTRVEKAIAKKILKKEIAKKAATGESIFSARNLGIGQRMLPPGVAYAGEGAAYGLGHLTSEAALGNTEFTAENVISHMGLGALMGAGITSGIRFPKEVIARMKPIQLPSPVKTLRDFEDLFTIKATGAMKPQIQQIKNMRIAGGDKGEVAKILRRRGIIKTGASFESTQARAIDDLKLAGKQLDEAIDEIDKAAKEQGLELSFDEIWSEVQERVIDPLEKSKYKTEQNIAKKLNIEFAGLLSEYSGKPIPIRELINERRAIRRLAWKGKSKLSQDTYGAYMDDVGRVLKEIEEEAADRLSTQTNLGDIYKKAKTDWQVLDWANKALGNKIDSETANLFLSLTDRMAAIGGGTASALAKGSIDPTALAYAVGGGLFNRTLRTRGASLASGLLNKINNLNVLQKVNDRSTNRISNAVSNFLRGKMKIVPPTSTKILMNTSLDRKTPKQYPNLKEAYLARVKELDNMALDPYGTQEKIAASTEAISEVAPETTDKINRKEAQIIQHLWRTKPRDPDRVPDLLKKEEYIPSDAEMAKWSRIYAAAVDPDSILEDLEAGRLSVDAIETFRQLWPERLRFIVDEIMSQIGDPDVKLKYQQKLMLSSLLGIPMNDFALPEFVAAMQNNFSQPMPQPGPERTPARAKGLDKLDQSGRMEPAVDRAIQERGE